MNKKQQKLQTGDFLFFVCYTNHRNLEDTFFNE